MNYSQRIVLLPKEERKRGKSGFLRIAMLFTALLFGLGTYAQQRAISGVVRNESGIPLERATLRLKGAVSVGQTDQSGAFRLTIGSNDEVLVVSLIGYHEQEVQLNDQSYFDIVLIATQAALDEVGVISYGTQQKTEGTGAVSAVSGSVSKRSPAINLATAPEATVTRISANDRPGEP